MLQRRRELVWRRWAVVLLQTSMDKVLGGKLAQVRPLQAPLQALLQHGGQVWEGRQLPREAYGWHALKWRHDMPSMPSVTSTPGWAFSEGWLWRWQLWQWWLWTRGPGQWRLV